jgi:sugar phosphate isomerase/epimerase
MKFVMFSKHLDMLGLSLRELGETIADIGFDGVDLTVRPGGRVEPEQVEDKLPEAVAALAQFGLEVPLITTAIDGPQTPYAEETFATASECDIPALKLGYWVLQDPMQLWTCFETARVKLTGLQSMALDYGVSANIHIHAGPYLSANAAVVHMLLEDMDPRAVGAYIDSGHMFIEGGQDGWRQGMVMLAPHTNLVALKGYSWAAVLDTTTGKQTVQRRMLGFEEAQQDWRQIFTLLKNFGYDGTVSLHSEYGDLDRDGLVEQTRRDLTFIKRIVADVEAG